MLTNQEKAQAAKEEAAENQLAEAMQRVDKYENETLNQRETTHGDFILGSHTAQALKKVLNYNAQHSPQKLTDVQREAADMICTKLSRIIAGDSESADHWNDIAGYAQLAAANCTKA